MIPTVSLLGLEFADLPLPDAADVIMARPDGAAFAYVVTPNADHLVRMSRDPGMALMYRNAWLRLLDSRVVAGIASICGLPVPPVVPGSDLTTHLIQLCADRDEKLTIVGMGPSWLNNLVVRYRLAPPNHFDPPMGIDHDKVAFSDTVSFILAHPSRLVFLAVGSPRQERLAAAVAASGKGTGTGLCIGASLAFLAGAERRAPVWMQRNGLEWAFRLGVNPRRLARRYLLDSPRVVPMLLRERRAAR